MDSLPVAGAGLCAGGAWMAWAVRGRSSSIFGQSVWRGPATRRAIALTFDDGPSESTPEILSLLAEYSIPATFFQVGTNVERLPAIARSVAAGGHAIGNHSHTHPLLCFRSGRFIEDDLRRAQQAIQRHTGVLPEWFRAPFGVRWFGLGGAQKRLGLRGVMWSGIGRDWKQNSQAVYEQMLNRASNGAILCLHDGRELSVRPDIRVTVETVRRLVPALLELGFEFETVSRLLCPTSSFKGSSKSSPPPNGFPSNR